MRYDYFINNPNSFPTAEANILRHIKEDTDYGTRPSDLAKNMKVPLNRITSWITVLRRRELVHFRKERSRYDSTRTTPHLVLTNLGRQRLAFLEDNKPSTCSSSSESANEIRER